MQSLLLATGLLGVSAQNEMRFFLTKEPKTPGKFYNPNDPVAQHFFKGVDDMDKICMDEGNARTADNTDPFFGNPTWEFLAFACDARQPSLLAKFPSFPNVPLVNNNGVTIKETLADYFAGTGGPAAWNGENLSPAECALAGNRCMQADLVEGPGGTATSIAGYVGSTASAAVVTSATPGRFFWHACDPAGNLEQSNPDTTTCGNWRSYGSTDLKGAVEDVGTLTGTGHPGHRTGTVDCDPSLSTNPVAPFVHIMCLQVIGATPKPTPVELPLYIFRSKVAVYDDGTNMVIDNMDYGTPVTPPAGLQGVDLLDWVCNNDPWATPNLVVSNQGPLTHGPYKAVVCTDPTNPLVETAVDKNRFLMTRSTRPIRRFPTRLNTATSPVTAISEPPSRKDIADSYEAFFGAMGGAGCPGTGLLNSVCEVVDAPSGRDDCTGQAADECYPEADCTTGTGCNEFTEFDNSGDCNGFNGGSPVNNAFQFRHWDLSKECDQSPTATFDCDSDRPNRLTILCMEMDMVRGVIRGDPHFVSFSGGGYDVQGEAGGVYNIISDKHLQFNSEFVPGGRHATYMGSVAIMFNNHTVWWQASMDQRSRNEKALMDGKLLPLNEPVKLADGEGDYYVMFAKKSKKASPRLEVKVPGYNLKFTYKHAPRRQYGRNMIEANRYRPHYFDFNVVRTFEAGHAFHPHGLLGQTARFYEPVKPVKHTHNGEGVIEGSVEDYRVSEQFGTDFKFNEFDSDFKWRA